LRVCLALPTNVDSRVVLDREGKDCALRASLAATMGL